MGRVRRERFSSREEKTAPKRLGRTPKCTEKLTRQFCRLTLRGLPPDGCCDFLGINPSTFWTWIKRGQLFLDGDGQPPEDECYGYFVQQFKRALAKYRLERLDRMHENSKDWVREMTILERRDRKSFGRNEPAGGSFDDFDPDARFL